MAEPTRSAPRSAPRAGAPVLRLRLGSSRTWLLVPGAEKLVGRDPSNQVHVGDPSVSRFHARLRWPEGKARPWIEDLSSANGTALDGQPVDGRGVELRDGATLELGDVRMSVELVADVPPALLGDDAETCQLFGERGAVPKTTIRGRGDLLRELLDLEVRRRTGTVTVVQRGEVSRLTFGRGRVVDAASPTRRGLAALIEITERDVAGTYEVRLDFEPGECTLNVSLQDFLRARGPARDATQRLDGRCA